MTSIIVVILSTMIIWFVSGFHFLVSNKYIAVGSNHSARDSDETMAEDFCLIGSNINVMKYFGTLVRRMLEEYKETSIRRERKRISI